MVFTYKWLKTNQTLRRIEDGACIPADLANSDYKAFLASGAVPAAEDPPPTQDQRAQSATDGIDKFMFTILFNMENRVRTLEGKAQITRPTYRQALVDLWKTLNP